MSATKPGSFQGWRQLSHQMSADLRTLEQRAARLGQPALATSAAALRARVEDRRFTLAVVGEFKRGKSTFLNALLGREILPSDVEPTTATLNRVTYGVKPMVELRYRDGRLPVEVPLSALSEHVTRWTPEREEAARGIAEAVVYYPVRLCRDDVDLLDTPGLSDDAALTRVTLDALPTVDAAILVVMADSPFSASEAQFLELLLREGVSRVVFVVNAMDRIRRPADRDRLLESIRGRVAATLGPERADQAQIFGISALEAVEARIAGDADRLAASGLPELEAALERMLTLHDALGLRRRLEQLDALAATLERALAEVQPAADPRLATRRLELDRLDALLDGLELLVVGWRRELIGRAARVTAALEEPCAHWPAGATARMSQLLLKTPVQPSWPAGYTELCAGLARALAEQVREAAGELCVSAQDELNQALGGEQGLGRLQSTIGVVLAHAATVLAELGAGEGIDALRGGRREPRPGLLDLDFEALARVLVPGPAELDLALQDPALVMDLQRYQQKSVFDRLVSLDVGGFQGRWVGFARARLEALVSARWRAEPPHEALRARLDEVVSRLEAELVPLVERMRAARQEVLALREREQVQSEQAALTRARDADEVAAVRTRTRIALGALERVA